MNQLNIDRYAAIAQPSLAQSGFVDDLKRPFERTFTAGTGLDAGACSQCMQHGVAIVCKGNLVPQTALESLRKTLQTKKVKECADGYRITFDKDETLGHEEYTLNITPEFTEVRAADGDGMRRAVYFLEDRIAEAEGPALTGGTFRRKPFAKHRITRCFFGPTYRPPFFVDELTNDIDYYPDEYLNKLAHEGVNGLWLTMYFRDLPSSVFPGRGELAEKRFAKLRRTVERCGRYGIKIYVFFSEPKYFGHTHYAVPQEDASQHPELIGITSPDGQFGWFCTSTEAGQTYLRESVEQIFKAVPTLGGMINIMFGEDNGSCVNTMIPDTNPGPCPLCSKRDTADMYAQNARTMKDAMKKYAPDAEYIGWFYAPGQRDFSPFSERLEHAVSKFPADCTVMLNFESGGVEQQLGKGRNVFDYSLAYLGPSRLFNNVAEHAERVGAKLQVGCSHEDASVPFIPVPSNLYEKYKVMRKLGVSAVMQCWYFGNYPGLMNLAAGELSFEPFPESEDEFLTVLAHPMWRKYAPVMVEAWKNFARGYREFPGNIAFEWYGPLHHSIAWPLHLFPADAPIGPSWLLKHFPEVSGDRVGECLIYQHTLSEALTLCERMYQSWQKGCDLMESLRGEFAADHDRLADIDLAAAINLQIKSTRNLLRFYALREEMLHEKIDHLAAMRDIAADEIANSEAMIILCERDGRLGYHSEAEGYLFFPEKLRGRIALLRELLDEDFAKFDLQAPWVDEYTGKTPSGLAVHADGAKQALANGASWSVSHDDKNLYFAFEDLDNTVFSLEIEPCRMWPPVRFDFPAKGGMEFYDFIMREVPTFEYRESPGKKLLTIPLALFDGYRDERFPMRVNVRGNDFSWAPGTPWEMRLLHRDYNPAMAGWLLLD